MDMRAMATVRAARGMHMSAALRRRSGQCTHPARGVPHNAPHRSPLERPPPPRAACACTQRTAADHRHRRGGERRRRSRTSGRRSAGARTRRTWAQGSAPVYECWCCCCSCCCRCRFGHPRRVFSHAYVRRVRVGLAGVHRCMRVCSRECVHPFARACVGSVRIGTRQTYADRHVTRGQSCHHVA